MAGKTGVVASSADGAMDAINAALGLEGSEAHEEPEEELEEGADGGDAEGDAESEGDEEGDEGEGDGDEEGAELTDEEKAAAVAKGERNADGTFKKPEPVKKADPINDPIPKDLKKETSDRMRSLIDTAKSLTVERDQVRGEFNTIIEGIKASGATPEQYGETISWLSLFNSPAPEARMKAYELINDVADRLATLLNIDRTVSDPLAEHADLKAAVTAGQITAKYAGEIARTRNANGFKQQLVQGQQQQQQQTQQEQQALAQARTDLNSFEADMKASDPLYARKRAAIVPSLQVAFKSIPPAKWAETFRAAYQNVRLQPVGRPRSAADSSQPLRGGKNPAGGATRQAGSMLDAVNGALAGMK